MPTLPGQYGHQRFNHIRTTRFFSQRDVAAQGQERERTVLVTSTPPADTLHFDRQHHSVRPKKNEVTLDESLNSEQERGDRILDLSPNFEGDKHSDERLRLSPEKDDPF